MKRILFLGCGDYLSGSHDSLLPLRENQRRLRQADVHLEWKEVPSADRFVEEARRFRGDAIIGCFPWMPEKSPAAEAWRAVRETQSATLAHFDCFDPVNSRQWECLPFVDIYWKSYLLHSVDDYEKPSPTGNPFPDFLARNMGMDVQGWHYRSRLDPVHAGKIRVGWSYAAMRRYQVMARGFQCAPLSWRLKPVDINVRFSRGNGLQQSWYQRYREFALGKIQSIPGARLSGTSRLPFRRYMMELWRSKLVVSPFGWGEVCYRDFEAVTAGALLLKPSMHHVRTTPDIFTANETYVPLEWDLSDLPEKCRYYLAHPDEAARIARNARQRYLAYFRKGGMLPALEELWQRNPTGSANVSPP